MKRIYTFLFSIALTSSCFGLSVGYKESFEEFVSSRDVVIRGTVLSVKEIDEPFIKEEDGNEYQDQIATVRIDEVLKNKWFKRRFKKGETIELRVRSTKHRIRTSLLDSHDPGLEAFWILKTSKKNYGLNTYRAIQGLNWEDRIKAAIKGKRKALLKPRK